MLNEIDYSNIDISRQTAIRILKTIVLVNTE